MFNMQKKSISLFGKEEPIKEFVVAFQTPAGLMSDFDEAVKWCNENNVTCEMGVKAIPLAITENLYEAI